MEDGKPIFKKENIVQEREEKAGYWTLISKYQPVLRELIINSTAKEIMAMCDGSKTLVEVKNEIKKKYPEIDENRIDTDVDKILSNLSRIGIVEWVGENPFLFKREEPISEGYSLWIGGEKDIKKILEFINSISTLTNNNDYFVYKSPALNPTEYDLLNLRRKLFEYHEEFVLLLDKGEIRGLISIEMPIISNSTSSRIKLILSPKQYCKQILLFALDNYPVITVKQTTKIRLDESLQNPFTQEFKKVLLETSYIEEGVLKNEFGFNGDIQIWSYNYDKNLIDNIDRMKQTM